MSDRAAQCRIWNADHAHQTLAGKARAATFTTAHQRLAGQASYVAFSVRMRAAHAGIQLYPQAAGKYLTPDAITCFLGPLPAPLQQMIYAAWCAGYPYGLDYWLDPVGVPHLPIGSLVAPSDDHVWALGDPGWFQCAYCLRAAFCPVCVPSWPDDAVLSRLPQVLCAVHGGTERG